MNPKKVLESHGPFLLSLKPWVTFVTVAKKQVNGQLTDEDAVVVGVLHKLPENMLGEMSIYWDAYESYTKRKPVSAVVAMSKIPPMIMGVKTDIVETGKIVAL